jgi:uncharacterized hydrophobic protein (TIGR00271 family)
MLKRIKDLFHFGEDAASEKEIIDFIVQGVNFRGAKLWILIIAVFVASLGLNTNSAAVIIGAMLISPLMGPIIGLGLGAGIYDFDLLRRSWRNFIIATIFSILTATVYFLITPINVVQSELLARTSPTIYDVLIALCGGLAGIIALSSYSQRTGNVIPGVAIATALMPPLCTVGFGLATANWTYAAGALYLFIINSIFIALATFIGAMFIMKFQKKTSIEDERGKKMKRAVSAIALITIIPSLILTFNMVRENYFEQRVSRFIQAEMKFPMTYVISHNTDFKNKSFDVVLIGKSVDSLALQSVRDRLPFYHLKDVDMKIIQDVQAKNAENLLRARRDDMRELHDAKSIITEQHQRISTLEKELLPYTNMDKLSPSLIREMRILFPQTSGVTTAQGTTAYPDSTFTQPIVVVTLNTTINKDTEQHVSDWLKERTDNEQVLVVFCLEK